MSFAATAAEWAYQTDINDEHAATAAAANRAVDDAYARLIPRARVFAATATDPRDQRMLHQLIYGGAAQPSPPDPAQADELARLAEQMIAVHARGGDDVGRAERPLFTRYVELANTGARAAGFASLAEEWQAGYDMPPAAFVAETDRLWTQVAPLVTQLNCFVNHTEMRPESPLPEPREPHRMLLDAEAFYSSLNFAPLPDTLWTRSMLAKPPDKLVVCAPSTWDLGNDDLRLKMCVLPTRRDLRAIHHELGHAYYFRAYRDLPFLLQSGANDGFHEAIGNTVALSLSATPANAPDADVIEAQLRVARATLPVLASALAVDRWRWDVFSGAVTADHYNEHWWELQQKYEGVGPPLKRTEADFDAGAQFHVAANQSDIRYVVAIVLEFQLQRALCKAAGVTGPLRTCSIRGSHDAGMLLHHIMERGASQPWQDTLAYATGERDLDASALLDYFAPLSAFLATQNAEFRCPL